LLRASDLSQQHLPTRKQTISAKSPLGTGNHLGEVRGPHHPAEHPNNPPDPPRDDVLPSELQQEPPGRVGVRQV